MAPVDFMDAMDPGIGSRADGVICSAPLMTRLIVSASEQDADILYATRFFVPDPFLFLEQNGRRVVLLNDLEIDRGRREAKVDEVVSYAEVANRLPGKLTSPFHQVVIAFLKSRKVRSATVPASFPLGLASKLSEGGIKLKPAEGFFWKERQTKTDEEIKMMTRATRITEVGMARGIEVLKAADAKGKTLKWNGQTLTSEILRAEIESAILRVGGSAANTIVAGGIQACDPHERGHGPLRPNQLIVLDIFPKDASTGYFGDLTRTVIRGKASDAQRKLWEVALEGQKLALKAVGPGVFGGKIHEEVTKHFTAAGFPTEERGGRRVGFFHGTGHGLGLEVHEGLRFSNTTFRPGNVVTVEPGLYYPEIGGVRHEDVVVVSEKGCKQISRFPKPLEI